MKNFKPSFFGGLFFLSLFLLHPVQSYAQFKDWGSCVTNEDVATLGCIPVLINNIVTFLIMFSGIVAVFLIIYSGYKYLSSQGDPQKLDSARKTFLYAIIGLILIALAYFFVSLIGRLTGVEQLPQSQ